MITRSVRVVLGLRCMPCFNTTDLVALTASWSRKPQGLRVSLLAWFLLTTSGVEVRHVDELFVRVPYGSAPRRSAKFRVA